MPARSFSGAFNALVNPVFSALTGRGRRSPDYFPIFRQALAASKAGTARTLIGVVGDSTGAGAWGGSPSNGFANNAYAGAVPRQLENLFVGSGLPRVGRSMFGSAYGGAATTGSNVLSPADYLAYHPEVYTNTSNPSWSFSPSLPDLGGAMATGVPGTPGGVLGMIDANGEYDRLEFIYPMTATASTATGARFGASTSTATFSERSASDSIGRQDITGTPGPAGGAVGISANGSGNSHLIGLIASKSSAKGVMVVNMGWSSSTSDDWANRTSAAYGTLAALPLVGFKLVIINLTINDATAGTAIATYKTNIQAIINAAKATPGGCDVLLVIGNPNDPTIVSYAVQQTYAQAIIDVGAANRIKVFDIRSISGFADYAAMTSAGYVGNGPHPNGAGYAAIAQGIYGVIGNP